MTPEKDKKKPLPPTGFEPEALIINRPYRLNPLRKGIEWSVTSIGWLIWFFLCRPFLLTVLWFLGVKIFYEHMVRLGGWHGLLAFGKVYLTSIIIIFVVVQGWNIYNLLRFRNRNSRRASRIVQEEEMEQVFQLPTGTLKKLQSWSEIRVDFSSNHSMRFRDPAQEAELIPGFFDPSRPFYPDIKGPKTP